MIRVAYQGTEGAFSEEASLRIFPDAATQGMSTFHQVFQAVDSGAVEYGVVPVENSVAGSINQTYDLLLEHDLHVTKEYILRVRHCLLSRPGIRLEDVKRVISHPQALAQCDGFLARHHLPSEQVYDTAGAAQRLMENGEEGLAAIASKRAAERYGLVVLQQDIEDFTFNFTRFFVLAREEAQRAEGPWKTSLVFAMRRRRGNTPGGLYEVLEDFAHYGVNMTKLESRPRRDRAWSYVFYMDIEGHVGDQAVSKALLGLLRRAAFVKVLGSYPQALPETEDQSSL